MTIRFLAWSAVLMALAAALLMLRPLDSAGGMNRAWPVDARAVQLHCAWRVPAAEPLQAAGVLGACPATVDVWSRLHMASR